MRDLDVRMEDNIAGAILIDPETIFPMIQPHVSSEDFCNSEAKAIYLAASSLYSRRSPMDAALLMKEAAELGMPVQVEYCSEAMNVTPTLQNSVVYAKAVHAAAMDRAEQEIGSQLSIGEINGLTALGKLQEMLHSRNSGSLEVKEAERVFSQFINDAAKGKTTPFLPTGLWVLDDLLGGGLAAGGLITIAARPGTGKTTAGICIAENVAASGKKVLYISLEMTMQQIWACRVANFTMLNRTKIYRGAYPETDASAWSRISKAFEAFHNREFRIRDVPSSLDDIEREARCINGLDLIVVDHIGLVKPPSGGAKGRYEVMTEVAHRLKQMALSMQIPILALCQLNRSSLERSDKRPTMADLRDSGAIEEDSDAVILLFREAEYLPKEKQPKPGQEQEILFIVDKNRYGTTGIATLKFFGSSSKICV